MFLGATVWFSFDLCWFGSIIFRGVSPFPALSTRRRKENPSLNVCLGRSVFIELAFVSDHSPAEGRAPKERADPATGVKLCRVSSDQWFPAAPERLGLSPALVTDAEGVDLTLTCSSRGGQTAGGVPACLLSMLHRAGGRRSRLSAGVKVTFREVWTERRTW